MAPLPRNSQFREFRFRFIALALAIAAQLGVNAPARAIAIAERQQAQSPFDLPVSFPASLPARFPAALPNPLPIVLLNFMGWDNADCARAIRPALGGQQTVPVRRRISDLLGTRISKLEQIRMQQQSDPLPQDSGREERPASIEYHDRSGPVRALGDAGECSNFTPLQPDLRWAAPAERTIVPGTEDFLASRRLPIASTRFDASWNRVRRESLSKANTAALRNYDRTRISTATLAAVNSWANDRIRYVEDRVLYGKADYWATASATLKRRAGDCEDIAIAKMQLLAAMGFARSDMYLTIVRDLVRNADHAVLVVKLEGRHFLLDNATNRPLDASDANDYRPIFSFANDQKWLHGATAVASDTDLTGTARPLRISLVQAVTAMA